MLVYKDGSDKKDILGFRCDLCDYFTLTDVIPNKHGEFHYICPKCKHHMKEVPETKEETKMVNTYTVSNAAKRLNCSVATIQRAITDGRFHDCFMEAGYHGRPAWMIPSDQVEEWVSKGGFLQAGKKIGETKVDQEPPHSGRFPWGKDEQVKKIFDPTIGKEVEVLDLLHDDKAKKEMLNEFEKRVVRRVNNKQKSEPKYVKVLDRTEDIVDKRHPWIDPAMTQTAVPIGGDTDGDAQIFTPDNFPWEEAAEANRAAIRSIEESLNRKMVDEMPFIPVKPTPEEMVSPVVRTDDGFRITFPTEMVENLVHDQIKKELSEKVAQLRAALDLMNEELKKLEEAIV